MQLHFDTSTDGFLGGRLQIQQPKQGFRSGHDAVLLAASLMPETGAHICELGIGSGVASLCLLVRHGDISVTGIEINPDMVMLARVNAAANHVADRLSLVEGDVTAPVANLNLPLNGFDAVIANPPYFERTTIEALPDADKQLAYAASADALMIWVKRASALVKVRGMVSFVYRADGLDRLLMAIGRRFGGLVVQPIAPKPAAAANRVVVRGQRDSRAPLTLLPPLVLQNGDGSAHAEAEDILRHGAVLAFARAGG